MSLYCDFSEGSYLFVHQSLLKLHTWYGVGFELKVMAAGANDTVLLHCHGV